MIQADKISPEIKDRLSNYMKDSGKQMPMPGDMAGMPPEGTSPEAPATPEQTPEQTQQMVSEHVDMIKQIP
ncbi:hypothetical protein M0R04_07940 [Candidatus Dojkabacteria bacterium]|jgi:hypothetical protein|nr:hypothetical protein [Candidatus Dojkabacteria bacterium]